VRVGKDGRPPINDRAALLRRLAMATAENQELRKRLEQVSDEYQTSRETLEQLLQLQASSERSSMRQVAGLLRAVQALAARPPHQPAPAAPEAMAAEAESGSGGDGGESRYEDQERPRARGGADIGEARAEADCSVEQSLQRLVMSMGEQIREKAAMIGRLEAGPALDGGDASGAPATPSRQAQLSAARQLQAQLSELRKRRDEVKRETAEAERRLAAARRQEATPPLQQQPRPAQRASSPSSGPAIKIKDPLRREPSADTEACPPSGRAVGFNCKHPNLHLYFEGNL
jgi:hypothetical protein